MDIASFIPEYPDPDQDPNFSFSVARKKEFYDLRLERSEKAPKVPGELLKSQIFMQRFFSEHTGNRKSLIFHGLGTGKCVHPDTLVDILIGNVCTKMRIEDIWNKYKSSIREDDQDEGEWSLPSENICVFCADVETNEKMTSEIKSLYRQYVSEYLVKVVLENGSKILITTMHRLFDGIDWTNKYDIGDEICDAELNYSKIKYIDYILYEGWVYDLEVFYYHNYTANGFLCHNTCLSSAVVENLKSSIINGQPRRPALIFVRSEDLARNYSNEITKVCTNDVYIAKQTESEIRRGDVMTKETKIARINKAVSKSYEIVTIETFLKNLPPDNIIKQRYSNRVIIIDEAHMLRRKQGAETELEQDEKIREEQKTEEDEKYSSLYKNMHHFLHTVEDCWILLLTGTPIWDKVYEISELMNLILSKEEQLPTGNEFKNQFFVDGVLTKEGKNILKSRFWGKVSYLRQMTTTAKKIPMGTTEPWMKNITIFPDAMSDFQAKYAKEAKEVVETKVIKIGDRQVTRTTKGGTVLKLAREAMNMVVPIFDEKGKIIKGGYDQETFKNYFVSRIKKKGTTLETYSITNSYLRKALKENLATYSAKFSSIIKEAKEHPNEVIYVYIEDVTGPGGAISFGLCLQLHGFIWAKTSSDIRSESDKKRFAVITSNPQTTSQPRQIIDLLRSSNKPDNCYGSRLQIIIGSEKIALGFTIKHVRQVHIVMPHWNMSAISQAEARAFRFGGHDALKPEERYLKIYNHVAVERDSEGYEIREAFPENTKFSEEETADIYVYKIAEDKDIENAQIHRLLKEVAYDCPLNYSRNVLEEDEDGSRDCDYRKCKYICDGWPTPVQKKGDRYFIPEEELDYSTYNLFYSEDKLQQIIDNIVELFGSYFSLRIDAVQYLLSIDDKEFPTLLKAIDIIIETRLLIKNRFGFLTYLKEQGNILFLDNDISPSANYPECAYIENPLVSDFLSMSEQIEIIVYEKDLEIVKKFCITPTIDIFNMMSHNTKVTLLEASYINRSKRTDAGELVLDVLGRNIYSMSDGTKVHILFTEEFKGLSYNVAAKDIKVTGLMRILSKDESRWDYISDRELEEKYVEEIKKKTRGQKVIGFENNPYGVFGWISTKDGSFRITLKPRPGQKGKSRGKACKSYQRPELIDILINKLEYLPDSKPEFEDLSREDLMKNIRGIVGLTKFKTKLSERSDEDLRKLLTVFTYQIDDLCNILKERFETLGYLFYI